MTKTYLVPKVDERGEDVKADAAKFDSLLDRMLQGKPETNAQIVARRKKKLRTIKG